jgi:hypothetical protein
MKFGDSKTSITINIGDYVKTILFYSVVSYFQLQNSLKEVHLYCHIFVWNDVFVDIWWSSCEHDLCELEIISVSLWCHFCTDDM